MLQQYILMQESFEDFWVLEYLIHFFSTFTIPYLTLQFCEGSQGGPCSKAAESNLRLVPTHLLAV